jgi:hypothetical protein
MSRMLSTFGLAAVALALPFAAAPQAHAQTAPGRYRAIEQTANPLVVVRYDTVTRLLWAWNSGGWTAPYATAQSRCEALTAVSSSGALLTGFALPWRSQLITLIAPSQSRTEPPLTIDNNFFRSTNTDGHWTRTPSIQSPATDVMVVGGSEGAVYGSPITASLPARCVLAMPLGVEPWCARTARCPWECA